MSSMLLRRTDRERPDRGTPATSGITVLLFVTLVAVMSVSVQPARFDAVRPNGAHQASVHRVEADRGARGPVPAAANVGHRADPPG